MADGYRFGDLGAEAERVQAWSEVRAMVIDPTARATEQTAQESRKINEALAVLLDAGARAEKREASMLRWTQASAVAAVIAATLALASLVVAVIALA